MPYQYGRVTSFFYSSFSICNKKLQHTKYVCMVYLQQVGNDSVSNSALLLTLSYKWLFYFVPSNPIIFLLVRSCYFKLWFTPVESYQTTYPNVSYKYWGDSLVGFYLITQFSIQFQTNLLGIFFFSFQYFVWSTICTVTVQSLLYVLANVVINKFTPFRTLKIRFK